MFSKILMYLAVFLAGPSAQQAAAPAPQPASVPSPSKIEVAEFVELVADEDPAAQVGLQIGALDTSLPLLLAQAPAVATTKGLGADKVVGEVQSFYKGTEQLEAKFRQTVTNVVFGKTTRSDGKLWIKKPGKMRWDYMGTPRKGKVSVRKSFISDGTTLWAVEHDNKQVFKRALSENLLPVAVTFLYGQGDLRRDFVATLDKSGTYGDKGDYTLKLVPKKPSAQYKRLFLVVDSKNFRVKQSVVIDASDNVNRFQFFEPNMDKVPADSWFTFNESANTQYQLVKPESAGK